MRSLFLLLVSICCILYFPAFAKAAQLPAFPGAEGFGANSIGGRGGKVIKVTNLNDDGPGSLRSAVSYSGPRIVVFETSGIINLKSRLTITSPYLTLAGETSPGGILVTGYTTMLNTHDVIIRHMRFRVGSHRITDGSNADPETLDSFTIWGNTIPGGGNESYNIIIDHCSFGWGVDETFSTAYNARGISIQWSLFSEALRTANHPKGEHSKGLLFSGKYSPNTTVTLHHSYISHNSDRNPLISGPDPVFTDIQNNIIYNWHGALSVGFQEEGRGNLIHNYMKRGIDSGTNSFEAYIIEPVSTNNGIIYTEGNIGVSRLHQSAPEWCVAYQWSGNLANNRFQRSKPHPAPPVTTQVMSLEVANCILSAVGATAPQRDSVDERVIADFMPGTGRIIDNIKYPEDFPSYTSPAPPNDDDNDGMADSWEKLNRMNTSINDSAGDIDNDGYTNIEEYLHSLSDKSYDFNSQCMALKQHHAIFPLILPILIGD